MSDYEKYVKRVVGFVGEARAEKYGDVVKTCFEYVTPKQCSKSIFWQEKSARLAVLNKDRILHRGDRVKDRNGWEGIVVKIIAGTDNEDHGTIYVWQENQMDYGADNCEHYCEINWRENLEVLESLITEMTLDEQ